MLTFCLSPHPYPKSEVDEESLPIRLIDVDASLEKSNNGHILFCKPNNSWDFHIISHTWSQHIRDLSKAVWDKFEHKIDDSSTKYTEAFEEIDWRASRKTRKAYFAIKEFLLILKSEGVKRVWLDAICINQSSSEEKDREIPRMASYYKYNAACFVPINGFASRNVRRCNAALRVLNRGKNSGCNILKRGKNSAIEMLNKLIIRIGGRKLLHNSEDKMVIRKGRRKGRLHPDKEFENCIGENDYRWLSSQTELLSLRWFNRVWTLQELLLPKNVYFVVQLERWMEDWLLELIRIAKTDHFSCGIKNSLNFTSFEHSHCEDGRPHLKRVDHKKVKQPRLYFVNSLLLLGFLAELSNDYIRGRKKFPRVQFNSPLSERCKSLHLLQKRDEMSLQISLLSETRNRECHEDHPQDHILGILGLLGISEKVKVTASVKKTPEEQLVELACQAGVFSDEMLLQMCFMAPNSGRNLPGMSWIPDLTGALRQSMSRRLAVHLNRIMMETEFKYIAEVIGVSPQGLITLKSPILRGMLYIDHKWKRLVWTSYFSKMYPNKSLSLEFPNKFGDDGLFLYRVYKPPPPS